MFSAIEFTLHIFFKFLEEAYEYLAKCGFQRNVDENRSQGEGECVLVTYTQTIPKYGTCWKVNYSIVQYQKWHRAGSHLLMLALHIIYEIRGDVDKYIIPVSTENSSCFWAFAVSLCWYDKVNLMFVACRKGKVQVLFFSILQKFLDASLLLAF